MKTTWLAVPALLALAACGSSVVETMFCPPVIFAAVGVTAVDSVTSVNVTGGSTLVLSNAAGTDSLDVPADPATASVSLGPNRSGTFTLRVRRTGYKLWEKAGIKVESGECGPQTVQVTAKLQAVGPSPQ